MLVKILPLVVRTLWALAYVLISYVFTVGDSYKDTKSENN